MAEEIMAEKIAAKLRRDILRGKYPPGSSVKERDNAKEMGVSRTPMREAIRMLSKEGLIVLRHSRSPVIAQPTFKEVSDAIDVLLTLENLSVQLACQNASEKDLQRFGQINDEMADKYDRVDKLDLFELDMAFHTAIVEATHNQSLIETYKSYLERLWRARYLSARQRHNRDRVIRQHAALLDAITKGDKSKAKKALHAHLGRLAIDIRPVIEAEYDLQSTKAYNGRLSQ